MKTGKRKFQTKLLCLNRRNMDELLAEMEQIDILLDCLIADVCELKKDIEYYSPNEVYISKDWGDNDWHLFNQWGDRLG